MAKVFETEAFFAFGGIRRHFEFAEVTLGGGDILKVRFLFGFRTIYAVIPRWLHGKTGLPLSASTTGGPTTIREFLLIFLRLLDGGANFILDFLAGASIATTGDFDDFIKIVLRGGG